ncbi:MAG: Crp/Fnr family transcriptional regulator [Anaerolineales bacterium]|nr:Crp/Fnr family transcriptional regulator [Anaerolineales bacterium]MCX7609062.1 Crp/Fnr family transcriptional regulator [Anaerolineales bacterium]MDW8227133.1 Crp/Fnr family transcriptional regulator [Anaerolineales bacterium]
MHLLKVSLAEKLRALRSNLYFDHLDEAELHRVATCTVLRQYGRGEVIFLEGEESAGLHILRKGCIKLYRLSPQGREYIVRLVLEGDTFNEVSVFDNRGNPVNAEALETSQVWVVEPECMRSMVRLSPEFAQKVIYNLGQNLRILVQTVSEMAFYQVTHRLARLIRDLPEEEMALLTQEQMAARLGTVREVVARSLRELERAGVIRTENRRIRIADRTLLEQWTQGQWN